MRGSCRCWGHSPRGFWWLCPAGLPPTLALARLTRLSPAGAGVFFLSSAEGEQISFLFDCIVRGISPTKGPFGLRPVLPGAWGGGLPGALHLLAGPLSLCPAPYLLLRSRSCWSHRGLLGAQLSQGSELLGQEPGTPPGRAPGGPPSSLSSRAGGGLSWGHRHWGRGQGWDLVSRHWGWESSVRPWGAGSQCTCAPTSLAGGLGQGQRWPLALPPVG